MEDLFEDIICDPEVKFERDTIVYGYSPSTCGEIDDLTRRPHSCSQLRRKTKANFLLRFAYKYIGLEEWARRWEEAHGDLSRSATEASQGGENRRRVNGDLARGTAKTSDAELSNLTFFQGAICKLDFRWVGGVWDWLKKSGTWHFKHQKSNFLSL